MRVSFSAFPDDLIAKNWTKANNFMLKIPSSDKNSDQSLEAGNQVVAFRELWVRISKKYQNIILVFWTHQKHKERRLFVSTGFHTQSSSATKKVLRRRHFWRKKNFCRYGEKHFQYQGGSKNSVQFRKTKIPTQTKKWTISYQTLLYKWHTSIENSLKEMEAVVT